MDSKKSGWIIAVVIILLLALVGSCSNGSSSGSGRLVTGKCSHCNGSGFSKYGNPCGWCNATGSWAFYD